MLYTEKDFEKNGIGWTIRKLIEHVLNPIIRTLNSHEANIKDQEMYLSNLNERISKLEMGRKVD